MRHPSIYDPRPIGRLRAWLGIAALSDLYSVVHGVARADQWLVKISATIITFNEERNIARAIESLRCADEILVVDSGSSDRTVEIAENLGARVVESAWPGYAEPEKFRGRASRPRLDSVDRCRRIAERGARSRNLAAEERRAATSTPTPCRAWRSIWAAGFSTPAGIPIAKCASITARKARWVGDYVHESVTVSGTLGHLDSNLLHFTCESLSEHLKTMDRYTTLAAEQLLAARREADLGDA